MKTIFCGLFGLAIFATPAYGQEESRQTHIEDVESGNNPLQLAWVVATPEQEQAEQEPSAQEPDDAMGAHLLEQVLVHFRTPRERFYFAADDLLAAPDGNYAAQTREELQTYLDLKMDYEYIDSDAIRKQLNLENGQGIIINSVAENGLGHRAGFQPGDLVLQVDETPVDTQYKFVISVTENRGKNTSALLRRKGDDQLIHFQLAPVDPQDSKRWIIGVSVDETSDVLKAHLGTSGAVITAITDDSPAKKMGLMVNDIIAKIADSEISNTDDLRTAVQASKGNPVSLELIRNGKKMTVELEPKQVEDAPEIAFHPNGIPRLSTNPYVNRYYKNISVWNKPALAAPLRVRWVVPDSVEDQGTLENKLEELSKQIEALRENVESIKKAIGK